MTYKLSKIISPAFAEPHRKIKMGVVNELVCKGGRGSAKSSYVSVELVLELLKHPLCHAVVMRKVGNTLRTSVYAQICWAIAELGLANKFRCTVSPMECVYIPTGQKIMFFGMDDPGKLKSIKVAFGYIGIAWFEELDQFDGEEQIRSVEQSLFRGGVYSMCFKSFNPPAMARNWANRYVIESKPGKIVHHSTYLTTPPEWLGPRFLADADHLKSINPTAYRHEYGGEVVGSGTQVFENLRLEPISEKFISEQDWHYFGQDWGWYPDPNQFVGCTYSSKDRVLYIYEDYRANRCPDDRWAETIKAHKNDRIVADPGGGGDKSISNFRSMGFDMVAARKGPGSVEAGIKWLQSLPAIVIDPERCPNAAKEFSEYEYERNEKTGEVLQGYPDAANHVIDGCRYALEQVWRRRGM
ncbi:PBSX family phage terminase large subunit [Clostridiaceae bacterium NSJ-31]|uniref:PBSX family phage terminase large subunit n=1 Tax=Ligaoa zhengdingensis TaxID=2763658 RepID=A0A926DZK8_9FIRM|nr:PBSX family phage terminase large subunit [Ligaoa zhengdingensis]MBC8546105.1 PBSX family phage terminase large subunit [Ligaoa zhengdingensis]